jgi:hypothetical protein
MQQVTPQSKWQIINKSEASKTLKILFSTYFQNSKLNRENIKFLFAEADEVIPKRSI